jgi:hypothetical protein
MDRTTLDRPAYREGILKDLESAKDALHAVDGNIEGILSRAPAPAATDGDIPILEDVVSDLASESSADAQLSLTNRYKTLSEWDLEKAEAASEAEAARFEPPLQAKPDEQDLMLQLDELLIDDELFDLDMELGVDDSLENLDLMPDKPSDTQQSLEADAATPEMPPLEPQATPLEPEQLSQLIDCVLEAHTLALKKSLFEQLAPLLCPHLPHRS